MPLKLRFVVCDVVGDRIARTFYVEDAAAIVALHAGGTIRAGHRVLWREGVDGQAGESYDRVAEVALHRLT